MKKIANILIAFGIMACGVGLVILKSTEKPS
jgi:hypothetical protein